MRLQHKTTIYKINPAFRDFVVYAQEKMAALRSIRLLTNDRFVKAGPNAYHLTNSNSTATYMIPDYMLDEDTHLGDEGYNLADCPNRNKPGHVCDEMCTEFD